MIGLVTYIKTILGYYYLFLITDKYSRKIVGWALRDNLGHEGAIAAISNAIKSEGVSFGIILHSDRGIQYCCPSYTDFVEGKGIKLSMTEQDHVYENALAERVNGILKQEFCLGLTFKNGEELEKHIAESCILYNTVRPHWSLNLKTPNEVHKEAA